VKTKYVLGFMFRSPATSVVLIRKNKPEWQKGLLNGVGGHVEEGETSLQAMVREFEEETGVDTKDCDWRHYATMQGKDWNCDCFRAFDFDAWDRAKTVTDERVGKYSPIGVEIMSCVSNIPWLIALALDGNDGRPPFATIDYL
jgi:8-oxo-dGTP diphosphatase